jgi:hypothetical protein
MDKDFPALENPKLDWPTRRRFAQLAGIITAGVTTFPARAFQANHPPIPQLAEQTTIPTNSAFVRLETIPRRLLLWAESDNSSRNARVSDIPNQPHPLSADGAGPRLLNYWNQGGPAQYVLQLREYWRPVNRSFRRVLPGGGGSISFTHTTGVSTTDTQSVTATLGLGGQSSLASASISATFSHSVTTDESLTENYVTNIGAPRGGMVRIWGQYQLMHELIALDGNGDQLKTGCRCPQDRKGEVQWLAPFPGHSGAFVSYEATRWLFPSKVFYDYQKDFPG